MCSTAQHQYPKLPTIIKTFITAETLVKWVEDALVLAKKKWEENLNLQAYITPELPAGENTES